MLFLNGKLIDTTARFPDGTLAFKVEPVWNGGIDHIAWVFRDEAELIPLIYLTRHLREHDPSRQIDLGISYVPNARMDRAPNSNDVFTLKYFCEIINSLSFHQVIILDPHSHVAEALLDRCVSMQPDIYHVLKRCPEHVIYYPDEGASKRYADLIERPYLFGVKRREWCTGVITGLTVHGDVNVAGRKVLMIDDICSRGGTFYHSAKALKEMGADEISIFCTHCENTIAEGELLKGDLIHKVFTTSSIFDISKCPPQFQDKFVVTMIDTDYGPIPDEDPAIFEYSEADEE